MFRLIESSSGQLLEPYLMYIKYKCAFFGDPKIFTVARERGYKCEQWDTKIYCCVVDTHRFFVVVVFFLAFLHVLYVSHKLNLLMLSSRLS